jgi:hypothetical protein
MMHAARELRRLALDFNVVVLVSCIGYCNVPFRAVVVLVDLWNP